MAHALSDKIISIEFGWLWRLVRAIVAKRCEKRNRA